MNTVSFYLPKHKQSNYIIVRIKDTVGHSYNIDTPLLMDTEKWNEKLQCPQNIYLKSSKNINRCLNRLKVRIYDYVKSIGENFSQEVAKQLIEKECTSGTPAYIKNSMLYHIKKYIDSRMHLITKSTYQRYIVFLRLLERFEGCRTKTFMIRDIKASFVKDLLKFGKKEKYNLSTLHRTIDFVKTVLRYLEKRGIRTFIYELELPKIRKESKVIILNEEELQKIKETEINEELETSKKWLFISCYSGQRISDFMNFCKSTIKHLKGKEYLSFSQQKTQKDILIPIHPEINMILSKNNYGFPKKLSLETYNRQIKDIAQLAGLDEMVYFNKRKGFRSSMVLIPKWQAISSHIGRRSFASNFFGKIPTALLMEATGHSSEDMFRKYVNATDLTRAQSLGKYFEENYTQLDSKSNIENG